MVDSAFKFFTGEKKISAEANVTNCAYKLNYTNYE